MNDDTLNVLAELCRGGKLAFDNAKGLYAEAVLLRKNGHLSRALALHQISMEESAKVDIVGAWATSLVCGHELDIAKMTTAIRSHKAKNYTNAYMSGLSEAEKAAREAKDWKGSAKAFKEWQEEIHTVLNTNKNASLYVDFHDGAFVAPNDLITEDMVDQIAILNQYFLTIIEVRLRALDRMASEPDRMECVVNWFVDSIKDIDPDKLESEGEALFEELFDRYLNES